MKRDAGIELLRCVLMFLIVFGHCCLYLSMPDPRVGKVLSIPGVFATDAFILISGWFGVRFSLMKVVRFLGLGVFACAVLTVSGYMLDIKSPFKYSLGWFGNSYLALMFLSPLINAGLEILQERGLVVRAWMLYAFGMLLAWLPIRFLGVDFAPTGWKGLSFNTMCFIYVTGRVLRMTKWVTSVNVWAIGFLFAGLMFLNLIWSGFAACSQGPLMKGIFVGSKDYDSPIVLGLAICFFLLFKRINYGGWWTGGGGLIAMCAPSMFSVYLISEGCHGRVSRAIYNQYACFDFGGGVVGVFLRIAIASLLVFLACLGIDCVRRVVLWSINVIKK